MRFSYTNAEKKMNFSPSHPKKFRSPAIEIPLHKRRNKKKNEKIKFSLNLKKKCTSSANEFVSPSYYFYIVS